MAVALSCLGPANGTDAWSALGCPQANRQLWEHVDTGRKVLRLQAGSLFVVEAEAPPAIKMRTETTAIALRTHPDMIFVLPIEMSKPL
jgi:hypothetical protein